LTLLNDQFSGCQGDLWPDQIEESLITDKKWHRFR